MVFVSFGLRSPMYLPIIMHETLPTAMGKERKINELMLNAIVCAPRLAVYVIVDRQSQHCVGARCVVNFLLLTNSYMDETNISSKQIQRDSNQSTNALCYNRCIVPNLPRNDDIKVVASQTNPSTKYADVQNIKSESVRFYFTKLTQQSTRTKLCKSSSLCG